MWHSRSFSALLLGALALCACAEGSAADLGAAGPGTSKDAGTSRPDAGTNPSPTNDPDAIAGDPCAQALAAAKFDFESGDAGWTHGVSDNMPPSASNWPYDPWEFGSSLVGTPCPNGQCFGASLKQNYAMCERGYLLSPTIDLSACTGKSVVLTFRHAFAFWSTTSGGTTWSDGGIVEISGDDGATWQVAESAAYPGTIAIRGLVAYDPQNPNNTVECSTPDGADRAANDAASDFVVQGKQGFIGKQATVQTAELGLPAATVTAKVRVRFSVGSGVSYGQKMLPAPDPSFSRAITDFGWRIDDIGFATK